MLKRLFQLKWKENFFHHTFFPSEVSTNWSKKSEKCQLIAQLYNLCHCSLGLCIGSLFLYPYNKGIVQQSATEVQNFSIRRRAATRHPPAWCRTQHLGSSISWKSLSILIWVDDIDLIYHLGPAEIIVVFLIVVLFNCTNTGWFFNSPPFQYQNENRITS